MRALDPEMKGDGEKSPEGNEFITLSGASSGNECVWTTYRCGIKPHSDFSQARPLSRSTHLDNMRGRWT
jgi:hypothetical protein